MKFNLKASTVSMSAKPLVPYCGTPRSNKSPFDHCESATGKRGPLACRTSSETDTHLVEGSAGGRLQIFVDMAGSASADGRRGTECTKYETAFGRLLDVLLICRARIRLSTSTMFTGRVWCVLHQVCHDRKGQHSATMHQQRSNSFHNKPDGFPRPQVLGLRCLDLVSHRPWRLLSGRSWYEVSTFVIFMPNIPISYSSDWSLNAVQSSSSRLVSGNALARGRAAAAPMSGKMLLRKDMGQCAGTRAYCKELKRFR